MKKEVIQTQNKDKLKIKVKNPYQTDCKSCDILYKDDYDNRSFKYLKILQHTLITSILLRCVSNDDARIIKRKTK